MTVEGVLLAGPVLGVLVPLPSWGRDWVAGPAVLATEVTPL